MIGIFKRKKVNIDLNKSIEESEFVVIDTETTDLNVRRAEIVSIGAVVIRNMTIFLNESFYRILKVNNVSEKSVEIHGITPSEMESGEEPEKVISDFFDFIEGKIVVGFSVRFDIRVLNKYGKKYLNKKILNPYIDIIDIWKRKYSIPESLERISEKLGLPYRYRHSAIDDAYTTALVFLKLVYDMRKMPVKTFIKYP